MSHAFDLIVLGAGSAGLTVARRSAKLGARVALFDPDALGGTCVNRGCVPKKAMWFAAQWAQAQRLAADIGFAVTPAPLDWARFRRQRDDYIAGIRQRYAQRLDEEGIHVLSSAARFVAANTLVDADGARYSAPQIVIATGARPHVPALPGIEEIAPLDSTSALALTDLPASLLVLGAGYIGVELAQLFARAGVAVTLVSRRGVLPEAEPEVSAALEGCLAKEGIRLVRARGYERLSPGAAGARLHLAGGDILEAERLLLATGRVPNSAGLNLAAAGIATDTGGGILVDSHMRTGNSTVWAAGDVTGRDQFVYMAAYGARLAARNAVTGATEAYDNTTMPWVVFSDPQVAGVGLSEARARARGHQIVTSVLPLDAVPRARAARDTRGLIKLVAEAGSRRLLGAQILAPEGADSIQTAAMALKAGMTYDDLGATIMPYLTTVEGLKLAAQAFETDVAALSCCAG